MSCADLNTNLAGTFSEHNVGFSSQRRPFRHIVGYCILRDIVNNDNSIHYKIMTIYVEHIIKSWFIKLNDNRLRVNPNSLSYPFPLDLCVT